MTTLWGEVMDLPEDAEGVEAIYRQHLKKKIPKLMAKWQPIVGEYADEVRLRKMTTRWGAVIRISDGYGFRHIWRAILMSVLNMFLCMSCAI